MFWTRLVVSSVEFVLAVFLAVFVVFWTYKSFVKATSAYDVEAELKKNNVAVAVLLTALMVATSYLLRQSIYPVMSIVTLYLTSPAEAQASAWRVAGYCLGHLALGFLLSLGSVSLALRLFAKLSTDLDEEREIGRGNVAVSIVMAGVVLVTVLYLQQGISGLTKTLIPQPALGTIRVLR